MMRRLVTCAHCRRTRPHHARGLCKPCFDHERTTYQSAELVAEYRLLVAQGYGRRTAAERLGISKARLDKAIERQARTPERTAA